MFRSSLSSRALCLAVVAGLALASGGCSDDSGVAALAPDSSTVTLSGVGLPPTSAMADVVGADDAQRTGLSDARARWNEDTGNQGARIMSFLQEASTFLDHEQMVKLTNLLADHQLQVREEGRRGMRCDQPGQNGQMGRHGRQGQHGQRARAGAGPRGEMRGPRVLEWADELDLTDQQRAAILEHHEAMRATMQDLRGDRSGPPSQMDRAKMRELHESNRAWMDDLLTDEQKTKLEELRTARRDERQGERDEIREARAVERLDALDQILGLSDGQREAVEKILAAQKEQLDTMRDEMREGAGPPDADQREAHAQAIEALREATREQISGVLTDEQRELFDALGRLAPPHPRGPRGPSGPEGH